MATAWVSGASANFTGSSTWFPAESTSYLDSEAGNTALTTSYQYSATFTPGVVTVAGVAVKLYNRAASPTGTITLQLYNSTGSLSVATQTINISDIDSQGASNLGWYFFQFASPVTLLAATAYKIGLLTSSSTQVSAYTNGTTANWARLMVTTTAGTPSAGDFLHIMGAWTGAGSQSAFTVTMDNTSTTVYGSTTPPESFTVNKGGTLTFGTSTSTNYSLYTSGTVAIFSSGTVNIGTSGTRIPSSSMAVWQFNSAANVDSGMQVAPGGNLNVYGTQRQRWTNLTSTLASGTNSPNVTSTSGWASGDTLIFAPTDQTYNHTDSITINTVNSSTNVTLNSNTTYAHAYVSGTAIAGEVGNTTSNVKLRGTSSSLQGYLQATTTATVNIDNAEIYWFGSATTNKRGIDIQTTTGSFSLTNSSLHDFVAASSYGCNIVGGASASITISNNFTYNITTYHILPTTSSYTVTYNLSMVGGANFIVELANYAGNFSNNVVACGSSYGLGLYGSGTMVGTFNNNLVHSCNTAGAYSNTGSSGGTFANLTIYRCAGYGLVLANGTPFSNTAFNNLTVFGCASGGVEPTTYSAMINCTGDSWMLAGDSTFSQAYGFYGAGLGEIVLTNSTFGVASGIYVAHTTADISNAATGFTRMTMNNCYLASTTPVSGQTNLPGGCYISSEKNAQTAGNHRSWLQTGNITIDTSIVNTGSSASQRLTPNNASAVLEAGYMQAAIGNSGQLTVSVAVRQSVSGDGTAYNGSLPTLVLKKNVALGISSDTVLATATSASSGSWQTLSATAPVSTATDNGVLTFTIQVNGTTGWVNVDTWSVT